LLGLTNLKQITDELITLPVSVVNTHGHLDHISCNHQYDTVYLHPYDEDIFLQDSNMDYRLTLIKGLLQQAKLPFWPLKLPGLKGMGYKYSHLPERTNRKTLSDGIKIEMGKRTLEVVTTPGHSPGSICLLDIERRYIYTGDTCCAHSVLLNLDHSCQVETFRKSILKLKALLTRFDLNLPAHHERPLDHSWMDDYLGCTERILDMEPVDKSMTTMFGDALVMKHKRISISYTPDRLWERDAKN